MKKRIMISLTSLLAGIFFVGCGGGDSSTLVDGEETIPSTYTISGTVPGTIIEAYCSDGSYYSTTSNDNGTTKHPFFLLIPENRDCKLVMITNETDSNPANWIITPIEFEVNSSLGTYLSIDKDIDLGNVPLETPGANSWTSGVKTPLTITLSDKKVHIKSLRNDPMDTDNDGIPNTYEDDDNDGNVNKYDADSHNDNDSDHDGIEDIYDTDDDNDGVMDNTSNTGTITLTTNFTLNDGRLLGSQCAQCHGTNGRSSSNWDSIAREDGLYHEMREDGGIMYEQALGYTQNEVSTIETWLNNQ